MNVSVVIPTRDRRELLRRALESVHAQTRPPEEIIVVDDGSTDATTEMVRRDFPGVVLLRQDGGGVSAARNHGIAHCKGEWIALLDSDDEWLPAKLERQMRALRAEPEALVCHTDEIWIRRGVRVNPRRRHAKHGGWIFEHCLPLCCMSPSSILVHRAVLDAVGLFDETLPVCEDYDLWLRITARYPVVLVAEPLLVKHGGHDDQLSRRYWGMDRFRVRALEKALASSELSPAQERAVRRVLQAKLRILQSGARKRGKSQETLEYGAKLRALAPAAEDHPPIPSAGAADANDAHDDDANLP